LIPTATASNPTAVSYLVFPIAENGGESSPVPDTGACQALFGYRNENPGEFDIPLGDRNYLTQPVLQIDPGGEIPSHFYADRVSPAFGVIWNVPGPISWVLDGQTATVEWCNP
jgi:hypothetical protein